MFEIKDYLDSGSESVVYKILEKVSKKPLVLKIIYRKQNEIRNINEFIISKKLKNKNISIFYGVEEIKEYNLDLVIIEYAINNNLRFFQKKILKRNYLSESLLCFFAYQILNGLKYCHMNKIAHLDIKPENIVVDEFLNLKIIDFSVSLDYSKIKNGKIKLTFQGTNFYVAPEVIKEEVINVKDLNKVDLYSFGVMLYKLAFGTYPYGLSSTDSHNYDKIYHKIQNEKLEFNKNFVCSSYFIDFLKNLLEKDINKRININEALDHYWIKCSNILINEKEKINNTTIFMTYLLTDHIIKFNTQINKKF
jgi:serine/threonine protein kinase